MDFSEPEHFYTVYDRHRTYVYAEIRRKHLAEFGRNIARPAEFRPTHRVLELGCGVGLFLAYLQAIGIKDFVGVEMDVKAKDFMPPAIREKVLTSSFETFFSDWNKDAQPLFDRIVLLDVFEHFSPGEGVALLRKICDLLTDDGRVVLRVPNAASPWGLQYQHNDLTHKTSYAPGNIRQLALAAGMDCVARLPYSRGSVVRRMTNGLIERALDAVLVDPPPIWSANFIVILKKA
ncbi:MAG: class I SAM-dependent methyltransferase [Magnetospirillum sp.]|nr:class I SAM-dependent methyltransferase [Magnetospirillum sp.]